MIYNLWDIETGSYLGQYTDEAEVLNLVRTLVSHHGGEYAKSLSLGRVRDDGSVAEPLAGAALIARADLVVGEREHANARQGEVITSRQSGGT